jgi:3-methyladenine DNA glycosylase AlkD
MVDVPAAIAFARRELRAHADAAAAPDMARYMKTSMPFYGVKTPDREPIVRELAERWPPQTAKDYRDLILGLWAQPHREEKYLAISLAQRHRRFITPTALPLYKRLIVEGAWWDLVDGVAGNLVGTVLLEHRDRTTPLLRKWLGDDDLWLRRTAIISQLTHKAATDAAFLFECCAARAHETEFFIRKAIGWALRQYARTDPAAVRHFVTQHGDALSGLSRREAVKHL